MSLLSSHGDRELQARRHYIISYPKTAGLGSITTADTGSI